MASNLSSLSPGPRADGRSFLHDNDHSDTASQRSISLSSPPLSPRNSITIDEPRQSGEPAIPNTTTHSKHRQSNTYTLDTDLSSEVDDDASMYTHETGTHESPGTSIYDDHNKDIAPDPTFPTYPPKQQHADDAISVASFASSSSRKARPESVLIEGLKGPLVLGVALVDFNHIVGPRIEWFQGEVFQKEEVVKILPFLALPDGAHLSAEDYSYFHLVPPGQNPTTVFGISCNQQIASSALHVRPADVTRSTVQKAVVVLASKPLFGPIRDKLGVVTTALFQQRNFLELKILDDFETSLELSLRGQLTESALYMACDSRELVHTFRQRTLTLVKALILQKRIMFYGHPVERLCTYQYSLVSLLPGLLQTLDDCGSPPLATRAATLSLPTSLKTSDRKSMMAYTGLPLDLFGKDAFFQPYIPLQQTDILKDTPSWLCGSTNTIVTQQKEIDLLVNIETGALEFRNPDVERCTGLTAADRKWMDEIVTDVNTGWNDEDPTRPHKMQFKGSDDYLRTKFDEYISAALATVRYGDYVVRNAGKAIITEEASGNANPVDDFNPLWIAEFKKTNAFAVWERITDPMLFDIVEPRHPCTERPSVVGDIGIRLAEGIQDLKLDQQLAPAREAVARTFTAGSAGFFNAVEGVKQRWNQRSTNSSNTSVNESGSSTPVEVTKADVQNADAGSSPTTSPTPAPAAPPRMSWLTRTLSSSASSESNTAAQQDTPSKSATAPTVTSPASSWGSGIGSFFASRAGRFSLSRGSSNTDQPPPTPPKASETPEHVRTASTSSASSSPSPRPPPVKVNPTPLTLTMTSSTATAVSVADIDASKTPTQTKAPGREEEIIAEELFSSPITPVTPTPSKPLYRNQGRQMSGSEIGVKSPPSSLRRFVDDHDDDAYESQTMSPALSALSSAAGLPSVDSATSTISLSSNQNTNTGGSGKDRLGVNDNDEDEDGKRRSMNSRPGSGEYSAVAL
ncbi:hypothetical protein AX16_004593 [Volvariella volvacea WC 439]|nr:hypothetical protein AX16_004593 [Volvariella volvacea WC 439]